MAVVRVIAEDETLADDAYEQLASLVRELHDAGHGKMLSFGERTLARSANAMLADVIAEALGRDPKDVLAEIATILPKPT
jgi:RNA polymerase-interacting CarD/CdnL/TRCF family regulator